MPEFPFFLILSSAYFSVKVELSNKLNRLKGKYNWKREGKIKSELYLEYSNFRNWDAKNLPSLLLIYGEEKLNRMEPDEESKKYQIPLPENISFTYSNNFPGIFELFII